jgi:DNA-binding response OmpR family regulator
MCVVLDCRRPSTQSCPLCGQILVPQDLALPPIKARILHAVQRRPGITAEDLRALVWADDPNGGPENRKAIHVHVHQLNKRLASFGFVVRAPFGAGAGYRIRSVS